MRTETAINESPASVSSAAAALAQQVFGDLTGCRVLLVGAGEVSELAARALAARGATIGAVTSRTQANAAKLAEAFDCARDSVRSARRRARPRGRRRLLDELVRIDPVAGLRCPDRKGRPLFVIDLAVPRDVDPAVARLEDCYLYDIDDLQAVVRESLNGRRREAERAEAIVEREAERFRDWQASSPGRAGDRVAARARREHSLR